MAKAFRDRIHTMNEMYKLPVHPARPGQAEPDPTKTLRSSEARCSVEMVVSRRDDVSHAPRNLLRVISDAQRVFSARTQREAVIAAPHLTTTH